MDFIDHHYQICMAALFVAMTYAVVTASGYLLPDAAFFERTLFVAGFLPSLTLAILFWSADLLSGLPFYRHSHLPGRTISQVRTERRATIWVALLVPASMAAPFLLFKALNLPTNVIAYFPMIGWSWFLLMQGVRGTRLLLLSLTRKPPNRGMFHERVQSYLTGFVLQSRFHRRLAKKGFLTHPIVVTLKIDRRHGVPELIPSFISDDGHSRPMGLPFSEQDQIALLSMISPTADPYDLAGLNHIAPFSIDPVGISQHRQLACYRAYVEARSAQPAHMAPQTT